VPDGGTVSTVDGDTAVYTCAGDGVNDELMFAHVTGSNSKYAYVVTDLAGNILGLPPGNTVNFEPAGPGVCLVWGLSFTGNITASMGDNALAVALSDDCFDLSDNYVKVVRNTDCVTDFTLIDAKADQDIGPLQDGDIIDLNMLPTDKLNVRANVIGNVESVVFGFDGDPNYRTENQAPYALQGDLNGNYRNLILTPGIYTLTASPFDQDRGQGNMGTPRTITFTVIDTDDEVSGFTLVDAMTNMDIGPLNDGDVIDLATIPSGEFNIRANTTSAMVGSVVFGVNANTNFRTENQAPYALGGDRNGNYNDLGFAPGMYTITATPYSAARGNGQAGISNTITVTVVGASATSRTALDKMFSFYPNPFQSQVTIYLDKVEAGKVEIEVYNIDGRLVKAETQPTKMGAFQHEVNLSEVPAGVYVIKVNTETYQMTKRLVKE
jgi:hypothetical protein